MSVTLREDLSTFCYCLWHRFDIKMLLCDTQYYFVADGITQFNTQRMHCCLSPTRHNDTLHVRFFSYSYFFFTTQYSSFQSLLHHRNQLLPLLQSYFLSFKPSRLDLAGSKHQILLPKFIYILCFHLHLFLPTDSFPVILPTTLLSIHIYFFSAAICMSVSLKCLNSARCE